MAADRLVSVLGLGFGDCGKGLCTDFLVRRLGAHTVVRFNGGAQAGHNVVLPDGRCHTFSQFGAGSFVPGVRTVLAHPVVVHPTALLVEERALAAAGVADAWSRLLIDPRCRVTTPFHQAAGRLREALRGAAAHGSCGAGFGETVGDALRHGDEALRWVDLAHPARAREKVERIGARYRAELEGRDEALSRQPADIRDELRMVREPEAAVRWLEQALRAYARAPASEDRVLASLATPGALVGEGAQGILLDETQGFHPHTTWSATGSAAIEAVVAEAGRPAQVEHWGVARSYLTRHGAGPLPTEDGALDALAEPHNDDAGWQGRFRRGHFDAVLFAYAVEAVGALTGLVVTHADRFDRGGPDVRWCRAYRAAASIDDADLCVRDPAAAERILALRASRTGGIEEATRRTRLLDAVEPEYDPRPPRSPAQLIERIEALARLRVVASAHGPTHADVRPRGAFATRAP